MAPACASFSQAYIHREHLDDENIITKTELQTPSNNDILAHHRFDMERPQQSRPLSCCDSVMDGNNNDDHFDNSTTISTSKMDSMLRRTECELILQGIFVENTFPQDKAKYLGFEYMLRSVNHSKTLALAMRSLQCVLVAQVHNDPRLLQEAAICYPQAMASLRLDLYNGTMEPGHFISVVLLFLKIELFAATSTQGGGWQQHIMGSRLAVERCRKYDMDPAIRSLIVAITYEFGLWDGLLRKRQGLCVLAQSHGTGSQDVYCDFLSTATQVPTVLEAADQLCQLRHNTTGRSVTNIVGKISAMEGDLHRTMRSCYGQINGLPYWVNRDRTFAQSLGYEEGDSYPKNIYCFPSFRLAQQHTTYWMCLLSLHEAHLDILSKVTQAQYSFKTPELRARLKRNAGECADQLVMSLSFLLRQETGYFGLTKAIAPLQLAYIWYRRCNDKALMLYCQRIAERIQSFGLNCPWSEW